jgi:hypothetical protein
LDADKLMILGISCIIALAMVLMFFIDRKYPKKEPKPDPVMKALFLTLLVVFVVYMGVFFDVWTKEDVKQYWWLIFVIFIAFVLFYIWVAKRKNPLPPDKILMLANKWVDKFYNALYEKTDGFQYDIDGLATEENYNIPLDASRRVARNVIITRQLPGKRLIQFFVSLEAYDGDLLQLVPSPGFILNDKIKHSQQQTIPSKGYDDAFNVADLEEEK